MFLQIQSDNVLVNFFVFVFGYGNVANEVETKEK